jgi:hypothetical protein
MTIPTDGNIPSGDNNEPNPSAEEWISVQPTPIETLTRGGIVANRNKFMRGGGQHEIGGYTVGQDMLRMIAAHCGIGGEAEDLYTGVGVANLILSNRVKLERRVGVPLTDPDEEALAAAVEYTAHEPMTRLVAGIDQEEELTVQEIITAYGEARRAERVRRIGLDPNKATDGEVIEEIRRQERRVLRLNPDATDEDILAKRVAINRDRARRLGLDPDTATMKEIRDADRSRDNENEVDRALAIRLGLDPNKEEELVSAEVSEALNAGKNERMQTLRKQYDLLDTANEKEVQAAYEERRRILLAELFGLDAGRATDSAIEKHARSAAETSIYGPSPSKEGDIRYAIRARKLAIDRQLAGLVEQAILKGHEAGSVREWTAGQLGLPNPDTATGAEVEAARLDVARDGRYGLYPQKTSFVDVFASYVRARLFDQSMNEVVLRHMFGQGRDRDDVQPKED